MSHQSNSDVSDSMPTLHNAAMRHERARLATFVGQWPDWAQISYDKLARAGFYYLGNGDQVQCFACGGQHCGWQINDEAMGVHSRLFPICTFVLSPLHCGNVSATTPTTAITTAIPARLRTSRDARLATFIGWPIADIVTPEALADSGFYYTGNGDTVRCTDCEVVARDWQRDDDPSRVHTSSCDHARRQHRSSPQQRHRRRLQQTAQARLRTFEGRWPKEAVVRSSQLALAGFYYAGTSDTVTCAFCGSCLHDWAPGDDPMTEHTTFSPQCPFVRHRARTQNNQMYADPEVNSDDEPIGEDIAGLGTSAAPQPPPTERHNSQPLVSAESEQRRAWSQMGICVSQAQCIDMATYNARLQSYNGWPENMKQRPNELALAGFYYTGRNDKVRCFHCDGGVHKWLPTDSPFSEHARWFPHCDYVRLCKGNDFVSAVNSGNVVSCDDTPVPGTSNEDTPVKKTINTEQTLLDVVPKGVDINHAHIRSALEMGYDEKQITRAIVLNEFKVHDDLHEMLDALQNTSVTQTSAQTNGENLVSDAPSTTATAQRRSTEDRAAEKWAEERTCKICMDAEVSVVILPCGHLCCCPTCAPALQQCPICRKHIKGLVRTYLS